MTDHEIVEQIEPLIQTLIDTTKKLNDLAKQSQNPGVTALTKHMNAMILAVKEHRIMELGQCAEYFIGLLEQHKDTSEPPVPSSTVH